MTKRTGLLFLLILLALPVVLLAQEATPEATAIELPAVDPLAVTGDIVTAGSSTVFPLSEAAAAHERAERGNIQGKIVLTVD